MHARQSGLPTAVANPLQVTNLPHYRISAVVLPIRFVSVTETGAPTQNRLQSITFGTLQNGQVTLNGQPIANDQVVTLPANTTIQTFTVRRAAPGQPTTVPLTVVDTCGAWPTLVGGGANAGF